MQVLGMSWEEAYGYAQAVKKRKYRGSWDTMKKGKLAQGMEAHMKQS